MQTSATPVETWAKIRAMDTPTLRAELAKYMGLSANSLINLAAIWKELESRGEDLSDLKRGWWVYIPHIYSGTVLPETVAAFASQPTVLRGIAALPIEEQRKYAIDGESIRLVERLGDGYTHRMLPPHALSGRQATQVFGDRKVRSESEQVAFLLPNLAAPKLGRPPKRGAIRGDRERQVVFVGRKEVKAADLLAALSDIGSPESDQELAAQILVKLTAAEHDRLKSRAVGGRTMQSIARDALRAAGMI